MTVNELIAAVNAALARFGAAAFRTECLRPVRDLRQGLDALDQEPPYYERYGERSLLFPILRSQRTDRRTCAPHFRITDGSKFHFEFRAIVRFAIRFESDTRFVAGFNAVIQVFEHRRDRVTEFILPI